MDKFKTMGNSSFSKNNDFGTPEMVPLRLQFWYFEYLKRHLLVNNPELCLNIFAAFTNVSGELNEKNKLNSEKDLLKQVIDESFYSKYTDRTNYLLPSIKKSLKELDFLCKISEHTEHYAHKLIMPHNSTEILHLINSQKEVADLETDGFFVKVGKENWITEFHSDSPEIHDSADIKISFNIASADFDFAKLTDEIKYRVAIRRHLLKKLGHEIKLSPEEMSIITKKNIPTKMDLCKHSSDESRAIGLFCWDKIMGLEDKENILKKIYEQSENSNQYPSFLNLFEDRTTTTRELLFIMIEKGLLKKFHKEGDCQHEKESCIYSEDGKKDTGTSIKDRKCGHYDSCLKKLSDLINHANLSVQKMQIIPIAKKW